MLFIVIDSLIYIFFYFHLFLAMVMYDNEVWNKGKWNLNLAILIIYE